MIRTRIDDFTTPLEEAEAAGLEECSSLLREATSKLPGGRNG
jgi:hypothetical protein